MFAIEDEGDDWPVQTWCKFEDLVMEGGGLGRNGNIK
jgi:hypothetical protein